MADQPKNHPSDNRLRLRAEDAEDLTVISAHLQDAVVAVADIAFLPAENRLAMVLNRFCWECAPQAESPAGPGSQRVLAGMCLDTVRGVKTLGIDRAKRGHLLELLSIRVLPKAPGGDAGGCVVELLFAGGQALRVTADRLALRLEDLEEPYPTSWQPKHKLDEAP
jgi:hypothetical protein